jgi:hypothetical protein
MVFSYRLIRIAVVVSCALTAGYARVGMAAPAPKVTICHVPPGNPTNVQRITVGAPAVPKHVQQHGDVLCEEGTGDCCADDDGVVVCTDLQSDVDHCGACDHACSADQTCTGGACVAAPNNTLALQCRCVDLTTGQGCEPQASVCGTSCSPDVALQSCAKVCAAPAAGCPVAGVASVLSCDERFASACVPPGQP